MNAGAADQQSGREHTSAIAHQKSSPWDNVGTAQ
jgi:hypothetical protein